ncbi:toll/interleukin-1 receptor domain-containing protein [Xanthomonas campestris pv. pennamericanum]|nr:toll/interleukin-1 receptor domain-containing protein [Xanthomonas campestris pv. pennamericanum]
MSCRILTSFAMANHGSTFMHWLRSELMKSLGLYDIDAVYVDSIVSRSIDDRATVAPDTRAHMRSPTGAMPIGAMREDWNALYQAAMRQAQLMLFCYTNEFRDSQWCRQEWDQFIGQKAGRPADRPLRGLILEFTTDACTLPGSRGDGVTRIPVAKTDGGRCGLAWDKGDYILSSTDYARVLAQIQQLIR